MVWIQFKTNFLSVMIWVQSVCKGYQQMTKVTASQERVNSEEPVLGKLVLLQHRYYGQYYKNLS